jgi:hypothetical protein
MNRTSLLERIWYGTSVPVFLERFILPALAAALIGVIVLNPLKLDIQQQISLAVVVVGLAYFVGHTVYSTNTPARPITSFEDAQQAARARAAEIKKAAEPPQTSEGKTSDKIFIKLPQIRMENYQIVSLAESSGDLATRIRVCVADFGKRYGSESAIDCNNIYAADVAEVRNKLRVAGVTVGELERAVSLVENVPTAEDLRHVADILDSLSKALAERSRK